MFLMAQKMFFEPPKIPGSGCLIRGAIALGWAGGGEMAISRSDPKGRTAAEPFYSVIGKITAPPGSLLVHGLTGNIRFNIGNEPLLPRGMRKLQQLLQKRYQI
jgi:putative peptide zinc metalloprotease protein